ncbi:MAG: tRNA 2-thiouridine(34) synthase MnmA [Desulfobacteraceae bacterium]|nr:tRNA 2-thiouridine(34) synthase MnmA [Desulfobacteraceae bacterium]
MQGAREDITVAMSGGVDSSVAAALLKRQGHAVRGVFMAFGQPGLDQQIAQVRRLASRLAVPLEIVDLREPFAREVLAAFRAGYRAGITPNPCVVCNRTIKCGALLQRIEEGARLATGHYARIRRGEGGLFELHQGRDRRKDQSYFLCRLGQEQLSRLLFPLGDLLKDEVRRLAGELGLSELHSPESQDICFLQGTAVAGFLEGGDFSAAPGEIVDREGRVLGAHGGIHRYTIGQRRGLGLPDATPYYVLELDAGRNRVIVGKEEELFRRRLLVKEVHWLAGGPPPLPRTFAVKIRYRHQLAPAEVALAEGGLAVTFAEPQRAITPGQFAVFYEGGQVAGSGQIVAGQG